MDQPLIGEQQTEDQAGAPEKRQAEKQYDDRGHLIVKLSDRCTVTISELNGRESCVADSYVGSVLNPFLIGKMYALLSVRTLTIAGSEKMVPPAAKNNVERDKLAAMFTAREVTALAEAYASEYMSDPLSDDDLKN